MSAHTAHVFTVGFGMVAVAAAIDVWCSLRRNRRRDRDQ